MSPKALKEAPPLGKAGNREQRDLQAKVSRQVSDEAAGLNCHQVSFQAVFPDPRTG